MNAPAAPFANECDRLAARLYAHATDVLPRLLPNARQASLDAIAAFVHAPGPAGYLHARGLLSRAWRDHMRDEVFGDGQARSFADGLLALRAQGLLPTRTLDRLARDLPVDPMAGRRLADLASLLEIWRALAGRVSDERRRRLESHPVPAARRARKS